MKIVFLGSPEQCIPVLNWLLSCKDVTIAAVITQPPKPAGRGRGLIDPPVAVTAKAAGLLVLQPESSRSDDFLFQLESLNPDVAITAAYGQILNEKFLKIPRRATINIHPSLLPKYRGATPVQSAILDGCDQSGVTVLFTVRALDAGNIITQRCFPIGEFESADSYMTRMFKEGAYLLHEVFEKLANPQFEGHPQDPKAVTHCRKIAKEDGAINWNKSAREICNQFRAYSTWPGIYSFYEGKRIAIKSIVNFGPSLSAEKCGSISFDSNHGWLKVKCESSEIHIDRLQWEGKKEVDTRSFWNGLKNRNGAFESE